MYSRHLLSLVVHHSLYKVPLLSRKSPQRMLNQSLDRSQVVYSHLPWSKSAESSCKNRLSRQARWPKTACHQGRVSRLDKGSSVGSYDLRTHHWRAQSNQEDSVRIANRSMIGRRCMAPRTHRLRSRNWQARVACLSMVVKKALKLRSIDSRYLIRIGKVSSQLWRLMK